MTTSAISALRAAVARNPLRKCGGRLDGHVDRTLVWRLDISVRYCPRPRNMSSNTKMCPFCGMPVETHLRRCPFCREEIPELRVPVRQFAPKGRTQIRRGLLYMLLAGIIHYFAAGYSGMRLPVEIPSLVTHYLTPLLFFCGLGLGLYGAYLHARR
jgi:hypothetical protein